MSTRSRTPNGMASASQNTLRAASGATGACMSAPIAPSNKKQAGSENFPPHAPSRPPSQNITVSRYIYLDPIYFRPAPVAPQPARKGAFGAGGADGARISAFRAEKLGGPALAQSRAVLPHSTLGALQTDSPMDQAVDRNRRWT